VSEPQILGLNGQPLQSRAKPTRCPTCGASADKRVLSGGFGEPHDVCARCGHEFDERTLP
jgi:hypothetical protein